MNNLNSPKVIALVPAHNEEQIIKATIDSLMKQSFALDYILIIADNCTDATVSIVKELQAKFGSNKLKLLETVNNNFKKSGALNQGFELVLKDNPDYIFGMDADTIVDEKLIEEGVKQFLVEPKTAGICSAYRTMPLEKNVSKWKKFLWRLQNIEFGLANAWRVENFKSARVLPGVSVMFRTSSLLDIYHKNNGIVWANDSLVEDYRLTLELKDFGWDVKSSLKMISWSDVPLSIGGKGGLFDQRQRWYSGTVDEIRRRGFQKHSRYELFTISLLAINFIMRLVLILAYLMLLTSGKHIELIPIFLLLPILASMIQFHRWLKYADQHDKWQGLMTIILLPNEIYAVFREFVYLYAIWLSYRRPNRAW